MNRDQEKLFEDHDKLLHHLAYRNIGRLTAVGISMDKDELYAIFCEVFVVAIQTWDETKGKLTTYLTTACLNKVSWLLKKYRLGENRTEFESVIAHRLNKGDEEFSIDIFIDEQSYTEIGNYELMDALKDEIAHLSPFAKILLEYTLNPPEFIERELQAQEAKHQFSTELNLDSRKCPRKVLNLNFVANCLIKTAESNQAKNFIRKATKEVEAAVMRVTI